MSRPTPDAIVTQIVQLLAALDVTTFSTHQSLRNAVLDLIDRSAKDFRDEIVERIDKRVHKKPRKHTREEEQLLDYLDETNSSVSANSKKVIERLGKALRGLHSSLHVRDDEFKIPDGKQTGQSSNATFFARTTGCRQARIMQHYRICEQKTHVNEGWRRLYRLWVVYEVDRLMSERTEPEKSEVADAVHEFCRLSGEKEEIVRDIRTKSQSYVTAANRENGLGIILMLGSRTTDAWERGRILDDDAVSWLWASCVHKHSQLKYKAEVLQRVACAVIRQGFLEYGIELDELSEAGHVFTRHFKAEAASRNSPAGLQVLAAAANQVESSRPESGPNVDHNQSTLDTQAQRQIRARDEGPIAGQVARLPPAEARQTPPGTSGQQASWQVHRNHGPYGRVPAVANSQPTENQLQYQPRAADLPPPAVTGVAGACSMTLAHQTSASNHIFSADTIASSDGTATVGTPGAASTPIVLGNHALQPRWSTYAEQIPSQRSLPQRNPLYGAQSFTYYNSDHASTTTGQQSPPFGCWPVATSRGLHETMAPHLLPDNGVNGIYHGTEGGGCTIDDEWTKVVDELFTQHGDDTSYPS